MEASKKLPMLQTLQRCDLSDPPSFAAPSKMINDGNSLDFWLTSTAHRDLAIWLFQLNRSMFPTIDRQSDSATSSDLKSPPIYSHSISSLQRVLQAFAHLIEKAPPSTGPRRFGNVAFRDWYRLAEDSVEDLLDKNLNDSIHQWSMDNVAMKTGLITELKSYLLGSFGSAQRLDYGTGHELSFLAFLACLWKLNHFAGGEERAIVMGVFQPYLELIRKLVLTYTLEPAGSHGVWGLDDHSFAPYIFGSAQLAPAIDLSDPSSPTPTEGSLPSAPSPATITKQDLVADYATHNMYFSAVQFIYDVKKGPFWEHSPVLYDVSGIKEGWGKINKGMLKMYAAEVLAKFPVVQHFPFGSMLQWSRDPDASNMGTSVHVQSQPVGAAEERRVSASRPTGTAAPWAQSSKKDAHLSTFPDSSGIASARAPGMPAGRPEARASMQRTNIKSAETKRPTPTPTPANMTAAPWVNRDPKK